MNSQPSQNLYSINIGITVLQIAKEKDFGSEPFTSALIATNKSIQDKLLGTLQRATDPSNFNSLNEYEKFQESLQDLDPVLKSDSTIKKENQDLFKAAFGNRLGDKIPPNQLTVQKIKIGSKELEFFPEKDSPSTQELRMPSGVVVNIKGATNKGNDAFYSQSNNGHNITVTNGFVKMYKDDKLLSMITPNGVRVHFNENYSHAKDAYTLMSANSASGPRAKGYFSNNSGPTQTQKSDALNDSRRKMSEAIKKTKKYSYGVSNFVPKTISNKNPVVQAFSPHGDVYVWNHFGNSVLDITSSFFKFIEDNPF